MPSIFVGRGAPQGCGGPEGTSPSEGVRRAVNSYRRRCGARARTAKRTKSLERKVILIDVEMQELCDEGRGRGASECPKVNAGPSGQHGVCDMAILSSSSVGVKCHSGAIDKPLIYLVTPNERD